MAKEVVYRCTFMSKGRCLFGNFQDSKLPSGASDTFRAGDHVRWCMQSPSKVAKRIVCGTKDLVKITTEKVSS